jgi:hypothetical protein
MSHHIADNGDGHIPVPADITHLDHGIDPMCTRPGHDGPPAPADYWTAGHGHGDVYHCRVCMGRSKAVVEGADVIQCDVCGDEFRTLVGFFGGVSNLTVTRHTIHGD